MTFQSGAVVQVVRGNKKHLGTLWVVEKEIESVTLVYSMGDNEVITHFPTCDLDYIGNAKLVLPLQYSR